jgi:hypothetical protein
LKNLILSRDIFHLYRDTTFGFNPETYEQIMYILYNNNVCIEDKTFLILKIEFDGYKIVGKKRILLNTEAKLLIDKSTSRIYFPDIDYYVYRVSERSYFNSDEDFGHEGKFALYNHLGKRLTKFVYDEIREVDEDGLLFALRNGNYVLLNKDGKEIKK